MGKAKARPEKADETTERFVERVNREPPKRNGLKKRFVWQKRRH